MSDIYSFELREYYKKLSEKKKKERLNKSNNKVSKKSIKPVLKTSKKRYKKKAKTKDPNRYARYLQFKETIEAIMREFGCSFSQAKSIMYKGNYKW